MAENPNREANGNGLKRGLLSIIVAVIVVTSIVWLVGSTDANALEFHYEPGRPTCAISPVVIPIPFVVFVILYIFSEMIPHGR